MQQSSSLFQTSQISSLFITSLGRVSSYWGWSPSPKEILNVVKTNLVSNLKSCQGKSVIRNERFESCWSLEGPKQNLSLGVKSQVESLVFSSLIKTGLDKLRSGYKSSATFISNSGCFTDFTIYFCIQMRRYRSQTSSESQSSLVRVEPRVIINVNLQLYVEPVWPIPKCSHQQVKIRSLTCKQRFQSRLTDRKQICRSCLTGKSSLFRRKKKKDKDSFHRIKR